MASSKSTNKNPSNAERAAAKTRVGSSTQDLLKKGSPSIGDFKAQVADTGISGIRDVAKESAKVDAEHQQANGNSTVAHQAVLKEGMRKAKTPKERSKFARLSEEADKRQKESAEQSADRSATTQRGAMKYIGWIAGVALGALGGVAIARSQKNE